MGRGNKRYAASPAISAEALRGIAAEHGLLFVRVEPDGDFLRLSADCSMQQWEAFEAAVREMEASRG